MLLFGSMHKIKNNNTDRKNIAFRSGTYISFRYTPRRTPHQIDLQTDMKHSLKSTNTLFISRRQQDEINDEIDDPDDEPVESKFDDIMNELYASTFDE